ncbi:hypothetical protein BpHYR1_005536 [Brachionus plicatilis]|uniref:Uncharacterized protein n=1 Tax=Brachionus plicatilis TaxID=10195 RepID=A0A3M7Q8R4_BRAPC|nr:hypothetical protein BpHYR1_005536 [Brachionus plicatilis]
MYVEAGLEAVKGWSKSVVVVGNFWPLVFFGRWKLLVIGCWSTSNHQLPTTPNLNYQQLQT